MQGHTLLARIVGADSRSLTEAIGKYVSPQRSTTPLKSTAAPPPAAKKEDTQEERLRGLMNQSKVVLFMKGSPDTPRCGFSRKICGLLRENKIEFSYFDILTDESVRQGGLVLLSMLTLRGLIIVASGLKTLNNWPTFPQLIINGELVGGLDIVQEMAESGELDELIA